VQGAKARDRILSRAAARSAARAAQRRGERVVFTNGCFDLLHVGHVRSLEQAKGLGDRLVVGVNRDASVRRLKGRARPVVSERQRAVLLAALACVDWVVLFGEPTPLARSARCALTCSQRGRLGRGEIVAIVALGRRVERLRVVRGIRSSILVSAHGDPDVGPRRVPRLLEDASWRCAMPGSREPMLELLIARARGPAGAAEAAALPRFDVALLIRRGADCRFERLNDACRIILGADSGARCPRRAQIMSDANRSTARRSSPSR
jgi:D-beta-D-heptose 7-phosphate kinase/D-beta-D-heptose 1-phosphate adenosyltransferase